VSRKGAARYAILGLDYAVMVLYLALITITQSIRAAEHLVIYHKDYLHFSGTFWASQGVHFIDFLDQFYPVFTVLLL